MSKFCRTYPILTSVYDHVLRYVHDCAAIKRENPEAYVGKAMLTDEDVERLAMEQCPKDGLNKTDTVAAWLAIMDEAMTRKGEWSASWMKGKNT